MHLFRPLLVVATLLPLFAFGCDGSSDGPGGGGGGGSGGGGSGGSASDVIQVLCEAEGQCEAWSQLRQDACVVLGESIVASAALSGCDIGPYHQCIAAEAVCEGGVYGSPDLCQAEATAFVSCHDAATEPKTAEPEAPADVKASCAAREECEAGNQIDLYDCYIAGAADLAVAELCGCQAEGAAVYACHVATPGTCAGGTYQADPSCDQALLTFEDCLFEHGC